MSGITALSIAGFWVGFFSAGTGIGGGALLLPLLVSVFGFDFKKGAAISLATIIPISCIGALSHFYLLPELPDFRWYLAFIPSCVAGTVIGAEIVRKRRNRWLKFLFAVFLLIASVKMLQVADPPAMAFFGLHHVLCVSHWLIVMGIGVLIGIIALHLGVGCGLLIIPFYVIILDFPIHQAITLSLTTIFFLSLSATLAQKKLRRLDIHSVKQLFFPALTGAALGGMAASHLPAPIMKSIFGVILLVTACGYILQGLVDYKNHLTP